MADEQPNQLSDHDFKRFLEEFRGLSGSMGKIAKQLGSYGDHFDDFQKAEERKRKEDESKRKQEKNEIKYRRERNAQKMEATAQAAANKLKLVSSGADEAVNAFKTLATKILGGAVGGVLIGGLADWSMSLTKSYREMAEVGQSFTGGLLDMSRSAAQSGVSLEEFGRMMTRNSAAVAQFSKRGSGFGALASDVRKLSEEFGMYGYTVQALNDFTGDYIEDMRLGGRLEELDRTAAGKSINNLAKTTTELAGAFGKSRSAITEDARQAQRTTQYMSRMMLMSAEDQRKFKDTFGAAITGLAAQPGEAGKVLSKMMAETAGNMGSAVFSEGANMFLQAGMPQVMGMMQDLSAQIENGADPVEAQLAFVRQLKAEGTASLDSLRAQALAGNKSAEEAIRVLSELNAVSDEEFRRRAKAAEQQSKLTKALLNFENVWARLTGTVRDKVLAFFESFIDQFDAFEKAGGFKELQDALSLAGKHISRWLGVTFDNTGAAETSGFLKLLTDSTTNLVKSFTETTKDSKSLSEALGAVAADLGARFGRFLLTLLPSPETMLGLVTGFFKGVFDLFVGAIKATFTWDSTKVTESTESKLVLFGASVLGAITIFKLLKGALGGVVNLMTSLTGRFAKLGFDKMFPGVGNVNVMNVNARTVNIYGPRGGRGGGGDDFDGPDRDRKGRSRRDSARRRGRVGRAARRAGRIAGRAGRFAGGLGGRVGSLFNSMLEAFDGLKGLKTIKEGAAPVEERIKPTEEPKPQTEEKVRSAEERARTSEERVKAEQERAKAAEQERMKANEQARATEKATPTEPKPNAEAPKVEPKGEPKVEPPRPAATEAPPAEPPKPAPEPAKPVEPKLDAPKAPEPAPPKVEPVETPSWAKRMTNSLGELGENSMVKKAGSYSHGALKALGWLAMAYEGYNTVSDLQDVQDRYQKGEIDDEHLNGARIKAVAPHVGGLAGAFAGAAAGGIAGSVVPGVGNIAGLIAGGVLGYFGAEAGAEIASVIAEKVVGETPKAQMSDGDLKIRDMQRQIDEKTQQLGATADPTTGALNDQILQELVAMRKAMEEEKARNTAYRQEALSKQREQISVSRDFIDDARR